MANKEHLEILLSGVDNWNQWRTENKEIIPDLSGADLRKKELSEINLSFADLSGANLYATILCFVDFSRANLCDAILAEAYIMRSDFSYATFTGAKFRNARMQDTSFIGGDFTNATIAKTDLRGSDFSGANLTGATLAGTDLSTVELTGADLSGANLCYAICVDTNFTNANIENAHIYGISVWNIQSQGLKQKNLRVTKDDEPVITVDNIEVAQLIDLILNNRKLRDVISTLTMKGVLILGRFTDERKKILNAIRDKLREYDFVPIMFDFDKAASRDFTETIKILAGMSRFVIADITEPKSSPMELQATVPDYQIPFLTIIKKGETPFSMFSDLQKYPWVLPTISYGSEEELLKGFKKGILDRAQAAFIRIKSEREKTDSSLLDIGEFS